MKVTRVAGVSGLVARLGRDRGERRLADLAFVLGLLSGLPLFALATGAWPVMRIEASLPLLVAAGFGSRLSLDSTSGHGVTGLARLSPRSIVAVVTFTLPVIVFVLAVLAGMALHDRVVRPKSKDAL